MEQRKQQQEENFFNKNPSDVINKRSKCCERKKNSPSMCLLMCTYYTKLTSIWSFRFFGESFRIISIYWGTKASLSKLIIWHQTEEKRKRQKKIIQ